jgi:pyrimidine-nucleoside phosphorylase
VKEAVDVLKGKKGDLRDVCLALASEMASQFLEIPIAQAQALAAETLDSGKALQKMREWITAQGGDAGFIDNPALLPQARFSKDVLCTADGFVTAMNAEEIGMVGVLLGAGRKTKADTIDFAAGMLLHKKTGDAVKAGEPLCTLFANKEETLDAAEQRFLQAVTVGDTAPQKQPAAIVTDSICVTKILARLLLPQKRRHVVNASALSHNW